MRNLTVLGSDSDTQINNMYYKLNQLCYHIAFHMLKDVEKAEEVTQLALIRLIENKNYLKDDLFQIKSYASVITQHMCLMHLRRNREETGSLNSYIDSSYITLKYVGDAELYSFIKAISLMSVNDRLVLILKTVHNLKPYQISRALHLKDASVKKRIDRGIRHLNYMQDKEGSNIFNKNSDENLTMVHAFEAWQDKCIDSFEAFANMDPHNFSYEYEEETIRKMSDKDAKPQISTISNDDNKGILLVAIAIFLVLSIIFTVWLGTTNNGKGKKFELVNNPDAEISESTVKNPTNGTEDLENILNENLENVFTEGLKNNIEISDEKANRTDHGGEMVEELNLDKELYAYDGKNIVFINPETGAIYVASKSDDVKELISISETMSEYNGVHQINHKDNTIYIAFMDGSGGYIELDSLELTVTEAWQKDWFENKKAVSEKFKAGVIVENVLYKFK